MSEANNTRVLSRRGDREVTDEEIKRIVGNGASVPTRLTDFMTGTSSHPDHSFDE